MGCAHGRLHVVITAGPTRERIDPVRFLSNYSTGYMGAQLASASLRRGHQVTVICGPVSEPMPRGTRVIPVESAQQMRSALYRVAPGADVVIMAAAVADFRPSRPRAAKAPRTGRWKLSLIATRDILAGLPRHQPQVVVGFALETGRAIQRAARKLRKKRLDLILAQQANGDGSPFGRRPVRAWLLTRTGPATSLGRLSKPKLARALLDKAETLWYGQHQSTDSAGKA